MRTLLVLSFLFVCILSVHYKKSIYSEKQYLNNLNEIQNKYIADLQKLRERIQKVKK